MTLTPTIPKTRPDHPSLDFELLRTEGISHLENLATEIWTDFNTHDPGITLLELLCYAITDLGYRTRKLPIADLLAKDDPGFFSPLQVLPSAPVTARDFRKLLIDLDGVKNAWLEKHTDTLNGLIKITLDLDDKYDPNNKNQCRPVVERVLQRLNAHRFLGQDYVTPVVLVGKLPVAICLHLDVDGSQNIAEAAAGAIWRMQQHLTPALRFHTFQEMRQMGRPVEQIYNGPLLDHGFLDDAEVDAARLRKQFYHSDLTNAATGPGVAVRELSIMGPIEANVFSVKTVYTIFEEAAKPKKAEIDLHNSHIYVTQNGHRREIPESALREPLRLLHLLADCSDAPGGLEMPVGIERPDLAEYRSLEYDLPAIYGVGENDVATDAPADRKAKRKQLKAYLAFFDQILASYLLQLEHVSQLLSTDAAKRITENNDTKTLQLSPTYWPAGLDILPELTGIIDPEIRYEAESDAIRQDRHNRALNHLLARFGEGFSDYVVALIRPDTRASENPYQQDFIAYLKGKADFLRELPALGHDRGKAYNYRGHRIWNTENVAGIKKRVHRLLALKGDWTTHSLLSKPLYRLDVVPVHGRKSILQYQVVFKVLPEGIPPKETAPYGGVLLKSARFTAQKVAQEKRDAWYSEIWNPANLSVGDHPRDLEQYAVLFKINGETQLFSEPLTAEEARLLLRYLTDLVSYKPADQGEGFHVLEHILLRPNDVADFDLKISLNGDPKDALADPYSGWLSVVIPNWTEKFGNKQFQEHFEQIFRQEMPAELAARFCWVDMEKMREFEERYMAWMQAKSLCTPDECHVTKVANELIDWLNNTSCPYSCISDDDLDNPCLPETPAETT